MVEKKAGDSPRFVPIYFYPLYPTNYPLSEPRRPPPIHPTPRLSVLIRGSVEPIGRRPSCSYPYPFQYVRPDRAASDAIARPVDQDGHDDDGDDALPEFPPHGRVRDDVEARVYAAVVVVVVVVAPEIGNVEDGGGD